MPYPLGLTLYALAQRAPAGPPPPRPPRPERPLVWLHAASADPARAARALARRIADDLGAATLITGTDEAPAHRHILAEPVPPEHPAAVRAFLDHWRPAAGIVTEGGLRPILLHEAADRGIPVLIVDARAPALPRGRDGWWPGLLRSTLAGIDSVFAVDDAAARAFRKAGAPAATVRATGRLQLPSMALPCIEAERAELARLFAGRPVWLAAALPADEEPVVIEAHRAALRLAHRMLLIVVPEDPARATELAARMEAVEGWMVARRAADEEPDAEAQVYIADSGAEYGLWYRLAPVTFLGGSLGPDGCRRDPLEAAALGSAIVHGPRPGVYGAVFARLAAARAAALVGGAADLAEALGELVAPDRAARMAAAAWAVASDGAEVTDAVLARLGMLLAGDGAPARAGG
jgi:3-deoxy-D-manno-octulosonic-acid transferase